MKKKVISLFLSVLLIVSIMPTAFAASDEATEAANQLYALGLFNGTGTDANGNPNFDLDRAPTRHEAVTMLVRLLGKGEEALAGTWETPFTDVAEWAKPYVGYAYANGLTSGTSATTYSGNDAVTASQYLTFVLRALGYDSNIDFQWDKAWELSDEIGLTDGRYNAETKEFLRGDVAIISAAALDQKLKGRNNTLRSVVTAPAASDQEEGEISLVLTSRSKHFRDGSNLGIGSGSLTFEVRMDGKAISSYTAVPENPLTAKLDQNGSNLTIEVTGSGTNAVTITAGGQTAQFHWVSEASGTGNAANQGSSISLYLPKTGGDFLADSNLGLGSGGLTFEVRLNGKAISDYTAVLENPLTANLRQSGSNLTLDVTASGPNAVNITVDGRTARFHWVGEVSGWGTPISLYVPPVDQRFSAGQDMGFRSLGVRSFAVHFEGNATNAFTATVENPALASVSQDGVNLIINVTAPGPNAVIVTVNGQTARFFWEIK